MTDDQLARLEERVAGLRRDFTRVEDEHMAQKARTEELTATINGHGQTVALLTPEYKAISKSVTGNERAIERLQDQVAEIEKWRQRVIGFSVAASALTSGGVYGILEALSTSSP